MSLRVALAALLEQYGRNHPMEASTVEAFREFLASGETLQGKANGLRHITASAWILSLDGRYVLLTHHAKLGFWVQLGGHTDEGEDWAAAALREAREESGLASIRPTSDRLFDLDIHTIPPYRETAAHLHYDLRFLFQADANEPLIVSQESRALAWVELSRLDAYTTEESQLRMREKTGKLGALSTMLEPCRSPST